MELWLPVQTLVNLVVAEMITKEEKLTLYLAMKIKTSHQNWILNASSERYDPNPEKVLKQTTDPTIKN